ncbi:MAG: DUF1002 domain-containing protein [Oscillospiraceae bacterium]|nr:DUF1002 domain-containing protein [Oscillospiraceae bacterium]MBO7372624.1 DUF1002 domain-containing protein [Oscillospiraceae bacterium]MBP5240122.1 DUF1002 domain-containing protein [Oscillospiraceae bacterium]
MMKRQNKLLRAALSILMLIALFVGLPSAPAFADAEMRRTVIGADLDDSQIETVYRSFGIERGTVPELRLTNAEERAALAGSLDEAVIGTRAISCVYFELLPEGSGLLVRTENISFCTAEMYRNALRTAGITDAKMIVAAPFSVSGTAAMAGVYKAYEDMTGESLNTDAKTAGTQELTVTGELADELGSDDSAQSIIGELKAMLSETSGMTDDEIRETIRSIADEHNVRLTETQVQQLLDLCRALEKLDPERLSQSAEDAKNTLQKMEDAKEKVGGFLQTVKRAFESMKSLFEKLAELTGKKG